MMQAVDARKIAGHRKAIPRRGTLSPDGRLSVVIGLEGLALGGCPINALDLGRALRDRGHRVNVFAIDEDARVSLIPYAEECGFHVTVLPTSAGMASRAWQIRRFAVRHSADVLHVFGPWLGPAASVAVTSRRRRLAIVTNWTMANVSYTPRRTPMIVGTPLLQEEAQAAHGSRVWLMEPPVDLNAEVSESAQQSFRHQNGIVDDEIAAVIVSRVDSHMKAEGIGYAVRAVAELDHPRLRLIIVGDGNAFDEIHREAQRVNYQLGREVVVMPGSIYDPRPAYSAADITLGMGGSALRSLAHGKPLIVLGERGFARIFEPASADYFLRFGFFGDEPNNDPVAHLAAQLRGLLDADIRRSLGEFGQAEVRARFGLDISVEALEEIYRAEIATAPGFARRSIDSAYIIGRSLAHQARRAVPRRSAHTWFSS